MATFVVCTRCSKTLEIAAIDQVPDKWLRAGPAILCPRCADANENELVGDVLDEEVIHPHPGDDTLDENFEECEVCRGPCQGH
jgi:hypothetical protein